MKIYKIQEKETGLFLRAGQFTFTSKVGKSWGSISALKAALKVKFPYWNRDKKYDEWLKDFLDEYRIIEYDVVEVRDLQLENIIQK